MSVHTSSPSGRRWSVVIAGGGTGGHLYPGLAVARELARQRPDVDISFAGTARGLEATVVPREGFPLDLIRSVGLKGRSVLARARGVGMLAPSAHDAWALLSRRRPSVVVGVGGYSSGPVVMLAALRRMPTLVLEQNAVPGLTNRLLARVVDAAAVSYDDTRSYFGARAFVSGNPVRAEFFSVGEPSSPDGRPPRVLVIGGSQGAHAINLAMVSAFPLMTARLPGVTVVHQTGTRDLDAVRRGYGHTDGSVRAEAFLDPVVEAVRDADLVVCRAGATTLAELAAAGRPSILIPFPAATDDHQRKNAAVLARGQAAVVLDERDLTAHTLSDAIVALLANPSRLAAMRQAVRTLARPQAAAAIAARIQELAA